MYLADKWTDYEVIDTSDGDKLERWGKYILQRPDPQVIWNTPKGPEWKHINAHYHRSHKGGGEWEFFRPAKGVDDQLSAPGWQAYISFEAFFIQAHRPFPRAGS